MDLNWNPERFPVHQGTTVFHAHKDEHSEVPLEDWFTLNPFELLGSKAEFDFRMLRQAAKKRGVDIGLSDDLLLRFSIENGLLPVDVAANTVEPLLKMR